MNSIEYPGVCPFCQQDNRTNIEHRDYRELGDGPSEITDYWRCARCECEWEATYVCTTISQPKLAEVV